MDSEGGMEELLKRLKKFNFSVDFNPSGDGNCFYSAAGHQLNKDLEEVKTSLFTYLANHQIAENGTDRLECLCNTDFHDGKKPQTWAAALEKLKMEYANNMVIKTLADCMDVNIVIVTVHGADTEEECIKIINPQSGVSGRTLYFGHSGNHYVVIKKKSGFEEVDESPMEVDKNGDQSDGEEEKHNKSLGENSGSEEMEVDENGDQSGGEDEKHDKREFLENVQICKITLRKEEKQKTAEAVLKSVNAVLNSGGGIVKVKIDEISSGKKSDKEIDLFWQSLEPKLNLMIEPSTYGDVFDKKQEGDTIFLFIKATGHFYTVDYNFHLPFDAAPSQFVPREKVVELICMGDIPENYTPEVPLTDLEPIKLLPKRFMYKEKLPFHESKQVELKHYTSGKLPFHNNNKKAQDKLAVRISSFGNGTGGMILIGIDDKTVEIFGQEIAADDNEERKGGFKEWESGFQGIIENMSKTWIFKPIKKTHWDIEFFEVDGTQSSFVIVVFIAGMRNLGGIFTKCPESFELRNLSGSDGKEEIARLNFHEWKQRMLHNTCLGQSKGTREVRRKFRLVDLLKGPLLTIQGSVEEIVEAFFPVGPKCKVVPARFESTLPEEAQQVIRDIQAQITNGLLVASPSMLSAVQKEKHRKEDGVICDLLLLSESLGGLHLISLVSSESLDQFYPHAHATAKAVKNSLVRNGGCYEKFYITCQVVLCIEGAKSFQKPSKDSRYPKEYHLRSSPQVKINRILQSLVIVLAQFPSFLSNKQGLSFLSLLTKEQFELLYNQIDEHRELWIHGPAGTGKTVVAVEFMRELLRRDNNLKPENILYVCEKPAMLPQMRDLKICECRTREAFMKETFPQVRHVILDEVHNFHTKDGDWLEEARKLVKQHESTLHNQGYLWCFFDKSQGMYKASSIPKCLPQTYFLTKVIRNTYKIFTRANIFLDKTIFRPPGSSPRLGKRLTMGHDFEGENITNVNLSPGNERTRLIEVLTQLLKEGYSKRDIAILTANKWLEGGLRKQLQEHVSTVSAEGNNEDSVVVSTASEYAGLERPVVVKFFPAQDHRDMREFSAIEYCALTRAMVKLVLLVYPGRKRSKKSN